jgi:hypothetical protein
MSADEPDRLEKTVKGKASARNPHNARFCFETAGFADGGAGTKAKLGLRAGQVLGVLLSS